MNQACQPRIRRAKPGEEAAIHEAHMRSIREICVKDHGEDEIKGWGHRPLGNRWIEAIKTDAVYVIEYNDRIHGVGHLGLQKKEEEEFGYIYALYFTPEVVGHGLGKKVMALFFEQAAKWNIQSIRLESTITALPFYEKFGFQRNGEVQKMPIGGHPVTCFPMICILNSHQKDDL